MCHEYGRPGGVWYSRMAVDPQVHVVQQGDGRPAGLCTVQQEEGRPAST